MSGRTVRRVARKVHRDAHDHFINPGDVYLEHTTFPGDGNYGSAAGRPVRLAECARCAQRYGREHHLGDVPVEQVYRDGLA